MEKRSIRYANIVFMSCVWGLVLGSVLLNLLISVFPSLSKYTLQYSSLIMLLFTLLPVVIFLNRPEGRTFIQPFRLKSADISIILIVPIAIGGFFFFTGINALLVMLFQKLGLSYLVRSNVGSISYGNGIIVVLLLGTIFPGIIEESLFRGLMLPAYAHLGKWKAITLTAFLFALPHAQIVSLPMLFAMGALLGYIRWQSRSVIPCMVYHALHNGISLIVYETAQSALSNTEIAAASAELAASPGAMLVSAALYIAIGGIVLFGFLTVFNNITEKNNKIHQLTNPQGKAAVHGAAKFTYLPLAIGLIGTVIYFAMAFM